MSANGFNEQQQSDAETANVDLMPDKTEITSKTIEKILVKKGVCTPEELKNESVEQILIRKGIADSEELLTSAGTNPTAGGSNQSTSGKNISFINIKNPYDRGRYSGLKRMMSRHRWSRKLGSALFGWKWRKVKKTDGFH